MGQILYYLPKKKAASDGVLNNYGLKDRIGIGPTASREVAEGPGGLPGVILAYDESSKNGFRVGYYPDSQTWKKTRKGYWVGMDTEHPPGPENLERERLLPGYPVELSDKNLWTVPVARSFVRGSTLPTSLSLDEEGELIEEPLRDYISFSQKADRVAEEFTIQAQEVLDRYRADVLPEDNEGDDVELAMGKKEKFAIAAEALAVNYRVGPFEISLLQLFTTLNVDDVLGAVIDAPALIEVSKAIAQAEKKT